MKALNSRFIVILNSFIIAISFAAANPSYASDLTKIGIIPKPVSVTATGSYFDFKKDVVIRIAENAADIQPVAQYLANLLNPATGLNFKSPDFRRYACFQCDLTGNIRQ
jgi:hexosaminidase